MAFGDLLLKCIQKSWISLYSATHWSNRSITGSYIISSYEIKRLLNIKNICWQFITVYIVD